MVFVAATMRQVHGCQRRFMTQSQRVGRVNVSHGRIVCGTGKVADMSTVPVKAKKGALCRYLMSIESYVYFAV
jgi:hypothetical protein